jgi:GT2 family glycosyltransferase
MSTPRLKVAVAIASLGRPAEVRQLVEALRQQTIPPCAIVISSVRREDVGDLETGGDLEVIFGEPGLCRQRNRALEVLLPKSDVVAFFDDDYLPAKDAIERIALFFGNEPEVAGACGVLLADGINSAGIGYQEAIQLLEAHDASPKPPPAIFRDLWGLYGCNMVYRSAMIAEERFDEALPLYGWQEDIDFAARMQKYGRTVKTTAFAGVHRGVKGGRGSGVRLGYSQIANPLYLMRKQTLRPKTARRMIWRQFAVNHVRAFRPEPWVDRLGRARGNWLAIFDALRGKLHPMRMLEY